MDLEFYLADLMSSGLNSRVRSIYFKVHEELLGEADREYALTISCRPARSTGVLLRRFSTQ